MRSRWNWVLAGAAWWGAVFLSGAALAKAAAPAATALPQPRAAMADAIVVYKARRELVLYANGRPIHVIRHIQLGRNAVGAKQVQGDARTPEGRYTIDFGKQDSAYHLALHVSYPSAQDRALAQARGQNPGGAIYIHGQPNDWPRGRVPGDWTQGCIALSNAEIEDLWAMVPDGTPIEIWP